MQYKTGPVAGTASMSAVAIVAMLARRRTSYHPTHLSTSGTGGGSWVTILILFVVVVGGLALVRALRRRR